jgi:hypothetical protein
MFYLACTRFNNATYKENIDYRMKYNESVIYGPAYKIRDIYPPGSLIFVAEMNNETNKIQGIGLIKNSLVSDKRHKVYENGEYNRYIYRGNYWISREDLLILDSEIIEIFDNILFKGKSHMKFRTGITILTEKLFTHWIYELSSLKNQVKSAFLTQFHKNNIDIEKDVEIEEEEEEEEEVIEIIPKKRRRINNKIKI